MPRESFERFYLTKVALGEGCGCAEHATRLRDLDASLSKAAQRERVSAPPFAAVRLCAALPIRFARFLRLWRQSGANPG